MIFLTSITVLICLLLVVTVIGRRLVDFLPSSVRDSIGFYVSPLLGLAGLVLITNVYGWLSPFKAGISISLTVGLLILGITFEKQRTNLFRDWLIVSAFAIIATIPILASIIRFDSFNPFNDTFTYLVHGQWLQEHAYSEAARASGFFPAETQVVLYQTGGHRMGASFFLGFVQSLFNLKWSYYAFPVTAGLAFALGSLAVGGLIRQVIPVSRTVALTLCTLPVFTMNGFVFGAQFGFFPQTFGLAFAAGLAGLLPSLIAYVLEAKPNWIKQLFYFLPLALCCAALLITYSDVFVAISAGIFLFLILTCSLYWNERYRIMGAMLILALEILVLVNHEGVRMVKNFTDVALSAATGKIHFGWPVLWTPIQFGALSFGMKSPFNSDVFWIDRVVSIWIFPALLIAMVVILVKIFRDKPKNLTILFVICINIAFWLAFLKFRYMLQGEGAEIGNTFLQFKLAKWLAPFNLGLLGIVIAWLMLGAGQYQRLVKGIFLTAFVAGMAIQYIIVAQMFTTQFQDETMRKYSPFSMFLDLRSRVASIPKDQVIYIGIPVEHHKLTQMIAYILSDRKLASVYGDGYIRQGLPEHERDMPIEVADWMIQLKPTQTADENPLDRVGPLLIRQAPFSFFNLESIVGAYGIEIGAGNTWNWVKNVVEYRFHSIGKTPKAKIKFQFLVAGHPRTLSLEVNTISGKRISAIRIPMKGGWGEYESPAIETNSEDITIRLKADGEPIRLSAGDSRETKFLIQNLSLESGL